MDRYQYLIRAHAIIAVIAFLILLPISIMLARFYAKIPGRGVRMHIYINILVLGLSTAAFVLGFMAVGPSRSLTNPHHGIGVAIYVLVLWQTIFGNWMRKRWKKHGGRRRPTFMVMLHQWLGRATGLLGVINVPLGLTLYGSPKWTFILYSLWMAVLLLVYFIQQHKIYKHIDDRDYRDGDGRSDVVIEEKKSGGFGKFLAPLAAGAGAVFLAKKLKGNDRDEESDVTSLTSRGGGDHRHHRNDSYSSVTEVVEKREKKKGGMMQNLLAGAAVATAGIFASKYLGKDKDKRVRDEEYSVVGHDSPRRANRPPQPAYSEYTDSTIEEVHRDHPPRGAILPAAAGAAIGAGAAMAADRRRSRSRSRSHTRHDRPRTPPQSRPPMRAGDRRDSYSSYTETVSPSARVEKSNKGRNALLGGLLGGGWLGKKLKDRRDDKEQRRMDEIRMREEEDRRRVTKTSYGGPLRPAAGPRRNTYDSVTESDLTSDYTSVHPGPRRAETAPLNAGSRMDSLSMPAAPAMDEDSYLSRRREDRDRQAREAEAAAATAGAALAAAEAERRRQSRSGSRYRSGSRGGERMAAAVKVRVGDQDVTVQRLTKEQQADRERRRRRGSLSDSDITSTPRYRRDESRRRDDSRGYESASGAAADRREQRRADRAADAEIRHMEALDAAEPLSPPRPAFARGRNNKDSAYYSGTPGNKLGDGGVGLMSGESLGPPESRGTWSAASPEPANLRPEEIEERRRERAARRRAERSQRGGESVDFN